MRWPWVSARAYDLALDERDRLRVQFDTLLDSFQRVARGRIGLREAPRPAPRPEIQAPIDIPKDVQAIYGGFQSPAVRTRLDAQVRDLYVAGTPWDQIKILLEGQLAE